MNVTTRLDAMIIISMSVLTIGAGAFLLAAAYAIFAIVGCRA